MQGNLASIANEDELGACEQIKVQLQAKDGTWPYVGFKCSNTSCKEELMIHDEC